MCFEGQSDAQLWSGPVQAPTGLSLCCLDRSVGFSRCPLALAPLQSHWTTADPNAKSYTNPIKTNTAASERFPRHSRFFFCLFLKYPLRVALPETSP